MMGWGPLPFDLQRAFLHMRSQEGLLALKNEKYVVSSWHGSAPLPLHLGVSIHRGQTPAIQPRAHLFPALKLALLYYLFIKKKKNVFYMKGYSEWHWFSSLPWGKGKGLLQANLYFQNRLYMWNVSGTTSNLGCKVIPHLSIAWELSMLCSSIYFSSSQVCAVSSDSHATEGHCFQALWMLPFWSDGPEESSQEVGA